MFATLLIAYPGKIWKCLGHRKTLALFDWFASSYWFFLFL